MDYDDCPTVCGRDEETAPGAFCEDCPVAQAKDGFKAFCEETLETVCPGTWRQYGFDSLKQTVEEISSMEDLPRTERTRLTHRLIQEFTAARYRYEKIIRQNEKPTE